VERHEKAGLATLGTAKICAAPGSQLGFAGVDPDLGSEVDGSSRVVRLGPRCILGGQGRDLVSLRLARL